MSALLVGFGLGLFVGSQPGPGVAAVRALGAARRVRDRRRDRRRRGRRSTCSTPASAWPGRPACSRSTRCALALGALGALVLAVIGARTLWAAFRVRMGGEAAAEVGHAAARVRHRAGGHSLQPAHDRDLGGDLRGRVDRVAGRRRRAPRRSAALLLAGVACGTLTAFTALSSARRAGAQPLRPAPAGGRRRGGGRRPAGLRRPARLADGARLVTARSRSTDTYAGTAPPPASRRLRGVRVPKLLRPARPRSHRGRLPGAGREPPGVGPHVAIGGPPFRLS